MTTKNKNKSQSSKFSEFIRNATPKQRADVFDRVMDLSIEEQVKILNDKRKTESRVGGKSNNSSAAKTSKK